MNTQTAALPREEKIILKPRKELARMCAEQRGTINALAEDYNQLRAGAMRIARAFDIVAADLAWAEVAVMALQQPPE